MRFVLLLTLAAVCANAQRAPVVPPLSELDRYLEITPAQTRMFAENLAAYVSWARDKAMRLNQVRSEIASETAKAQLDPLALGLRYVEVEAICRQGREKESELRRNNLNVLTAAQKTKLASLEEMAKVIPLIIEAQARNLLGGQTPQISLPGLPSIGGIISFMPGMLPGRNLIPNLPGVCGAVPLFGGDLLPIPVIGGFQEAGASNSLNE